MRAAGSCQPNTRTLRIYGVFSPFIYNEQSSCSLRDLSYLYRCLKRDRRTEGDGMISERTKRWPGLLAAGAIGASVGAAYVAEPMFRASHDHVTREGETGSQRHVHERASASAVTPVEVTE